MMTHETVTFEVRLIAKSTAVVTKSDTTGSHGSYFKRMETLRSFKFDAFTNGDVCLVTARCTSKRRHLMRINKIDAGTSEAPKTKVDDGTYISIFADELPAVELPVEVESFDSATPITPYFHVDQPVAEVFTFAQKMLLTNPDSPVRIMMVGPSGYGKTTTPEKFAELTGRKYTRMNCASVRDPEEWFGYRQATSGSTHFEPSEFIKTLVDGNVVIVLDEFNRLEPWITNTLFPLMDDSGRTTIYNQEFKIGPDVLFVGTINLGFQYTGTFELDAAMSNRFDFFCEVGPMPYDQEIKVLITRFGIKEHEAKMVVDAAKAVRALEVVEFSTRTSLQVARAVKSGLSVRGAIQHVVITRCPSNGVTDYRKQVIDVVNSVIGIYAPTKKSIFDN